MLELVVMESAAPPSSPALGCLPKTGSGNINAFFPHQNVLEEVHSKMQEAIMQSFGSAISRESAHRKVLQARAGDIAYNFKNYKIASLIFLNKERRTSAIPAN